MTRAEFVTGERLVWPHKMNWRKACLRHLLSINNCHSYKIEICKLQHPVMWQVDVSKESFASIHRVVYFSHF